MSGMSWKRAAALLATARVANVPSVMSNVWLGVLIGESIVMRGETAEITAPYAGLWLLVLAGVCLYVAGNFLNDWFDREWDAKHRPERGLPSGLFFPQTYLMVGVGLFVVAVVCAWLVNDVALRVSGAILVFVVAYTVLHKRTGWGVLWVGLCRSLLVVLGATGMVWREAEADWDAMPVMIAGMLSIPLFFYIIGLSISARFEAKGQAPKCATAWSLSMLILPMLLVWGGYILLSKTSVILWAAAPYAMWLTVCFRRRRNLPRYVSGLLAGVPLVDLMVLSANVLYAAGYGFTVSPLVYLFPLLAFAAGLLLQRVAPAS